MKPASLMSVRRILLVAMASLLLHAMALWWSTDALLIASAPEQDEKIISASLQPIKTAVQNAPAKHSPKPSSPQLAAPAILNNALSTPEEADNAVVATAATIAEPIEEPHLPALDTVAEPSTQFTYRVNLPPSVILYYDVQQTNPNGRTLSGSGSISWQRDGNAYRIDGEASFIIFSLIDFHSIGQIDEAGLAPELYSEKRMRRPQTNTHFNRERNLISFSASEKNYPRLGGEQDRASIFWQLTGIARGSSEKIVVDAALPIFVAGIRDGEVWPFRVTGQEEQLLGNEKMQTWHLVRMPEPNTFAQRIDIWLAPALEWYPVRLRQTEANGVVVDMRMQRFKLSTER